MHVSGHLPEYWLDLLRQQPPLKSPNTALVAAATTSGIQLSEDQPFVHTIEEDVVTGKPKRQTVCSGLERVPT